MRIQLKMCSIFFRPMFIIVFQPKLFWWDSHSYERLSFLHLLYLVKSEKPTETFHEYTREWFFLILLLFEYPNSCWDLKKSIRVPKNLTGFVRFVWTFSVEKKVMNIRENHLFLEKEVIFLYRYQNCCWFFWTDSR